MTHLHLAPVSFCLPTLARLQTVANALSQAGVFFLFAAICASGFAFVFVVVPETRGKSFEEIEALFN